LPVELGGGVGDVGGAVGLPAEIAEPGLEVADGLGDVDALQVLRGGERRHFGGGDANLVGAEPGCRAERIVGSEQIEVAAGAVRDHSVLYEIEACCDRRLVGVLLDGREQRGERCRIEPPGERQVHLAGARLEALIHALFQGAGPADGHGPAHGFVHIDAHPEAGVGAFDGLRATREHETDDSRFVSARALGDERAEIGAFGDDRAVDAQTAGSASISGQDVECRASGTGRHGQYEAGGSKQTQEKTQ